LLGLLRRTTLERAIQLALAATILTALVSAGSIVGWQDPARKLRWVALFLLVGLAVLYALRRRGRITVRTAHVVGGALLSLAVVSALWSAEPRLTVGRAGAFALVLIAAAALSYGASDRDDAVEAILHGVLLGAAAVAVGGLLVLAFRHDRAVQAASTVAPARYQGLGGGPNMAAMVMAIAAPLALHVTVAARARLVRGLGAATLALLLGSIAVSGSRGAFAAAFVGLGVYALLAATGRRRLVLVGVALGLVAATLAVSQVPSPAASNPPEPTGQDPAPAQVTPAPGYLDANLQGPRLQDDIGHPGVGVADTTRRERNLTGSSGRTEAWRGAAHLAAERPVVGFGFGTEDRTFVDRYVFFNSNNPENSYIGMALQLGIVGLVLFAGLAAALLVPALARARTPVVAAAAGGFAAALVLALFQSYIYAAGNAATAAAWVCGFAVLGAVAAARA
jgi:O-Antigen ligase